MEIDSDSEQSKKKSETLHVLTSGSLSSSIAKLSTTSRGIPSNEDFHFYYNFNEFKNPIKELVKKTDSTLKQISSSTNEVLGKVYNFPDDVDDVYDWLVNINDEFFERFDVSADEFQKVRKMEEESGKRVCEVDDDESGFQLVYGKKKKKKKERDEGEKMRGSNSLVKTVTKDARTSGARARIPFHIPSITKPQYEFKIAVDNSNEPFEHVWLEKSEDGSKFIHPLEEFSELDFVDRHVGDVELVKPLPIESTPFKLVEEVNDLKELAAKLCDVNEFAVDLEHNHYRSFQGITCLMQISTRFEDFVVDTLKLHAYIGTYLREVFKDPSKKKVMHGADRDIEWLQRDFGIYVCNLFDTGQASRILKLERNSLEYLLRHFCEVTANKEYQNADWRLRPIPAEMLKYAREDTHYLLHIYDLMRVRLLEPSTSSENVDDLLLEVYKRSYDICMHFYEKEILTDNSYLYIYGLQGSDFNSEQLAVVAVLHRYPPRGLCEWRDGVARAEDESTGFILPNKALLDIARQMPVTAGKLRPLVRCRHPYVERNLGSVVSIIKRSIANASAFESVAEQLQQARTEMAPPQNVVVAAESEALATSEYPIEVESVSAEESISGESINRVGMEISKCEPTPNVKEEPLELANSTIENGRYGHNTLLVLSEEAGELNKVQNDHAVEVRKEMMVLTGRVSTEATVQVLKKPSRAFGALLGNSSSKRKLGSDRKVEIKVEQIKSSLTLPFQSFLGQSQQSEPILKADTNPLGTHSRQPVSLEADTTNAEDIIPLEDDMNDQEFLDVAPASKDDVEDGENCDVAVASQTGDKPMSLSELSSSFQECLQSMNQKKNNRKVDKPQQPESCLHLKPFDYVAAREQMKFGEHREDKDIKGEEGHKNLLHSKERRKNSASSRVPKDEGTKDFQQARRRMAFPPTGNRTATFR
ncbi:hypothetical protein IFM89_003190 [Coptis chinensis]|uniref:HRDC domain-containing protein n=1 Tax=Coptis chinensis TaxID=261450 RepID=A0A835H1E3_9MAGN|nr:hypothetical protein IFM89_003190 [Coptis chinensis]